MITVYHEVSHQVNWWWMDNKGQLTSEVSRGQTWMTKKSMQLVTGEEYVGMNEG